VIIKGDYDTHAELCPFIEGHLEYLKFLKRAGNIKGALHLSKGILEMIDDEQVPTSLWASAVIEIAKLEDLNGNIDAALRLLIKLRYVLPPIDPNLLEEYRLPFNLADYLKEPLYKRVTKQKDSAFNTPIGKPRQSMARLTKEVVSSPQVEVEFDFEEPTETKPDAQEDKRVFSSFISMQDLEDESPSGKLEVVPEEDEGLGFLKEDENHVN